MREKIKEAIEKLNNLSKQKPIHIVSHHDTDGITSAAIMARALQRADKQFSLDIVRNLEVEYIQNLPETHLLVILDLGSGSLPYFAEKKTEVIILDHHEIPEGHEIPENVLMVNPRIENGEELAGSGICYLFAKELSDQNKDLANLAVIGMIGDMLEKNIGKTYDEVLQDAQTIVKKGLLIYPATRPLDRVLQSSFGLYIPDVTGSFKGVLELLREAGIEKTSRGFKSLAELSEQEMSNLATAIMLKKMNDEEKPSELIGNIFLVKFFNTQQDAREVSALINACSRMERSDIALGLCLGNKVIKKEAETIYAKYRRTISSALEYVANMETKIVGKDYVIINAQDKIKYTIIGTIASIMSFSPLYAEGTVIITMARNDEKIKVSGRLAGRQGRNVREVIHKAAATMSEEVGGHPNAAGCLIPLEKEEEFINNLKQTLEVELVRV